MGLPNNNNQAGGNAVYGNPRQDNLDLNKIPDLTIHDCLPRPFFKQTSYDTFEKALLGNRR